MTGQPFYFDLAGQGLSVFLGPTEAQLMELAWKHKRLTVKSALALMGPDNQLAYTTVMTVLNRLTDKQLLARHRDGRNFVYQPQGERAQFIAERIGQVGNCLKKNFPTLV